MGKPSTRWEDVVRRDTSQILGIRGWRRRAEGREEWRRILREVSAGRGYSTKDGMESHKQVFLNRRAAARYRALASIIPGHEWPEEKLQYATRFH